MGILAVTSFGQIIGLPSALFCAAFIVYLLVAPLPRPDDHPRIAISRFFVFVSLAFAACWFWMRAALPITAWLFLLGDNNHWFYDYSTQIAAVIALLASSVAFVRTMAGTVSRRYISVLTWSPPILLIAAAAVSLEYSLSFVLGTTPESAAQRFIKSHPLANDSMRLEALAGPPIYPDTPSDHRAFWIVAGDEKVGLVVVGPNRLLGWRHSRSHWFKDSTDILIDAQMYLEQGDKKNARYCLEQVARNLPGTRAEQEARRLLAIHFP